MKIEENKGGTLFLLREGGGRDVYNGDVLRNKRAQMYIFCPF